MLPEETKSGSARHRPIQIISQGHAPRRHSRADARRRVLQDRRVLYRPDAGGRQGRDHARSLRPCARRSRRRARDAGDARSDAPAPWRELRRFYARGRLWRDRHVGRRQGDLASRRPRPRFGADRSRRHGLRIVASGDYKNVADPTCVGFELVPCDVFITEATFGLPVFSDGDADAEIRRNSCASSRYFPSAPISSAPIRWARRSA